MSEQHRLEWLRPLVKGLEAERASAYKRLASLEGHFFDKLHNQESEYFEERFELDVFASLLKDLAQHIAMALEAAGLAESRRLFLADWAEHLSGLQETRWIPEIDILHSEPYSFLTNALEGLQMLVGGAAAPEQPHIDRLESMLRATAYLVRKRNPTTPPTREHDIQTVMDDYLDAAFTDYVKHPQITGHIKNFVPDGGVTGIKAAIEFKFVDSKMGLKTALSGILEDTQGYKGSEEWKRFYSVIYMTEPFETEERFRMDIVRVGATDWHVILVNGQPASTTKTASAAVSPPPAHSRKPKKPPSPSGSSETP